MLTDCLIELPAGLKIIPRRERNILRWCVVKALRVLSGNVITITLVIYSIYSTIICFFSEYHFLTLSKIWFILLPLLLPLLLFLLYSTPFNSLFRPLQPRLKKMSSCLFHYLIFQAFS